MSNLTSHFTSNEYIRVFLKPEDGKQFVKQYVEEFDAKLEYVFNIPRLRNLQVVAMTSPFGNISAVITETMEGLPEYLERTKIIYWTNDIDAALKTASESGMKVLQPKTPVPMGFQGRFETLGGYVVELGQLSEEGKQYLEPDPKQFGL